MSCCATQTAHCLRPEKRRTWSAEATGGRSACRKNTGRALRSLRRCMPPRPAMSNAPRQIELTGNDLTFDQLYRVAFGGVEVSVGVSAMERMNASRRVVEQLLASGATAYGINTGFGKLASVRISRDRKSVV